MIHRLRRTSRFVLAVFAFLALVAPEAYAAPAVPTVVAVSVTGNAHVPTDRILAVLSTKVGDPFDPAKVQADLRAIADMGFFADQAPPVIKQRPDGVAVTFRVIENPVVTSIRFAGNKSVSADTLLALMDTAPGQVFNIKTYQQDVLKINSYYDKIGFGGQLPSHVTDVNITPDGVLTLTIQEGLTVRNIIITPPPDADPVLPPALIIGALVTKPGSPYSEQQRDKDYDSLKALYEKYDLKIGDVEAGVDPASIDQKAGTADVRYSISVLRVGAIEITGNTKTHDDVIRRELRLRPGMVVTDSGLRRDYDRLNNLGFFEKIDFQAKPGPDPKRPGLVTLNWQVKEQRTGTASLGAGYSGGLTGTGLTGTLSYQENNINGTGNGGSIRLERGSRVSDASLSFTVPYLGKTEASQRYSLGATVFTQQQTNFYPVYAACLGSGGTVGSVGAPTTTPGFGTTTSVLQCPPAGQPFPVEIINSTSNQLVNGIVSTYGSRGTGASLTLGRRLTDIFKVQGGINVQSVAATASLPPGYFFPNPQNVLGSNTCSSSGSILGSSSCGTLNNALGITAPSIAQLNSNQTYSLRSFVLGFGADSRDDVFNPRRGVNLTVSDELSSHSFGSAFNYSIMQVDAAKFFPVAKNMTFGLHGWVGATTGAIPTNKLFIFSDQNLRGYTDPAYGTDILLGQAELRIPLTSDRKFAIVTFAESGATRIRGGVSNDGSTTLNLDKYTWRGDVGVGLRFDVPQLGLHTLRLDFAKGSNGTHTSFGIGQSF
ncbi:MAG TPA: POTRA domain-containing protein [Candidatus Elarobacter sp.]